MSERLTQTTHGDAPLSSAHEPDASMQIAGAEPADELVARTVTINRPAQELYEFWRDFNNLPTIMSDVVSIDPIDERRARWHIGSDDNAVAWESVITEDMPGELIAWTAAEPGEKPFAGRVEFAVAPAGRGTEVRVTMSYPSPGLITKVISKVTQRDPNLQTRRTLRRFKQLMEAGEIATAEPPIAAPRG